MRRAAARRFLDDEKRPRDRPLRARGPGRSGALDPRQARPADRQRGILPAIFAWTPLESARVESTAPPRSASTKWPVARAFLVIQKATGSSATHANAAALKARRRRETLPGTRRSTSTPAGTSAMPAPRASGESPLARPASAMAPRWLRWLRCLRCLRLHPGDGCSQPAGSKRQQRRRETGRAPPGAAPGSPRPGAAAARLARPLAPARRAAMPAPAAVAASRSAPTTAMPRPAAPERAAPGVSSGSGIPGGAASKPPGGTDSPARGRRREAGITTLDARARGRRYGRGALPPGSSRVRLPSEGRGEPERHHRREAAQRDRHRAATCRAKRVASARGLAHGLLPRRPIPAGHR